MRNVVILHFLNLVFMKLRFTGDISGLQFSFFHLQFFCLKDMTEMNRKMCRVVGTAPGEIRLVNCKHTNVSEEKYRKGGIGKNGV